MKYVKTYESFTNNSVEEGLFSFLTDIFKNRAQKRQLDKLAKKLTETRVELGRLKIEGDSVEDFKNELEDRSSEYKTSSNYKSDDSEEGNPYEVKIQTLENLEEDLVDAMDEIGSQNETLQKYVNKVKIESRLEASEKLIRLADGETAKILTKLKRKDAQSIKQADKELYYMRERHEKD
jgi:hypothetical protein